MLLLEYTSDQEKKWFLVTREDLLIANYIWKEISALTFFEMGGGEVTPFAQRKERIRHGDGISWPANRSVIIHMEEDVELL